MTQKSSSKETLINFKELQWLQSYAKSKIHKNKKNSWEKFHRSYFSPKLKKKNRLRQRILKIKYADHATYFVIENRRQSRETATSCPLNKQLWSKKAKCSSEKQREELWRWDRKQDDRWHEHIILFSHWFADACDLIRSSTLRFVYFESFSVSLARFGAIKYFVTFNIDITINLYLYMTFF